MFLSGLFIGELPRPDYWFLTAPLVWKDAKYTIVVPQGWVTDLASIPGLLREVPVLDVNGPSRSPAALHDFLYGSALLPRAEADQLLFNALIAQGVSEVDAQIFYIGVRQFGWHAWDCHRTQGDGALQSDFVSAEAYLKWKTAGAGLTSGGA